MKALVVCKYSEKEEKASACQIIRKEGFNIENAWKNTVSDKNIKDKDLVIAIGGDGTILSASHYIKDQLILAVNSSPNRSEGALTTVTLPELEHKLEQIKNNSYMVEDLQRLQLSINDKPVKELSLNEIFIGKEKSYLSARYKIKFQDKEEKQISSGIIITTGSGSTSWFKSAGGKPFSPLEPIAKLIIREPYQGKLINASINNIQIKEDQTIEITPLDHLIIAIDSIREIKVKPLDKISISLSPHKLKRIK